MTEIIAQYGLYHCAECGSQLHFEKCDIGKDEHAIGYCTKFHEPDCGYPNCTIHESNCSMANVRLKIPLSRMQVERA